MVKKIKRGSPADQNKDIKKGDVLIKIDGEVALIVTSSTSDARIE